MELVSTYNENKQLVKVGFENAQIDDAFACAIVVSLISAFDCEYVDVAACRTDE